MKKIKFIAFIASLAMCITLLGVGYATWYNVKYPSEPPKSGTLEAYDILNITLDEMEIFKFSMLSFKTGTAIEGDEFANSNVGEITVTYTVDAETLAATKSESGKGSDFCVNLSLGYDKTTVVGGYDKLFDEIHTEPDTTEKNKVTVSCEEASEITDPTNNGSEIANTCTFKGVEAGDNGAFTFTVTYTFTIPSSDAAGNFDDNFRAVFGQYLRGDTIQTADGVQGVTKFVASAHVTKVPSAQQ